MIMRQITNKYQLVILLVVLTSRLLTDIKLNFKVDKINVGICSAESIKNIKSHQYYHDFNFLGTCAFSLRISGSTELPPGTWLIIGLLYNDLRLQANKVTTVEEDGTFKSVIGVLKDNNKIFPGNYTIEVWYHPTRQDPDIIPKLQNFKEEIKKTETISIWNDTTNLPLHLEINRLIKFYLHLLYHLSYVATSLNKEFNKYFPQDMDKDDEGKKVKQEYKNAYKLYFQKQYDKIDYKKLCFKELCFVPNMKKIDFDPLEWGNFSTRWKKTALFFYYLARNSRDNCLINPFPEIATTVTLIAESLLSYLDIYEKRLYGSSIVNTDPLNPNPFPKGVNVYKLYNDLINTINITRNKILMLKDLKKPITLVEILRRVHSLYRNIVNYVDTLQTKLKKEKNIKKLIAEDNKFLKRQKKKLKSIENDLTRLGEFARSRKNQTLLQFSNALKMILSHLNMFYRKQGILNYEKYFKPQGTLPEGFLENFRIYRNSYLTSLKNLLQSIGNQELYINLNIEEEIKETSIPKQLTKEIEREIDNLFSVFKTDKQEDPDLFTKNYLALKNYDKLVIQYISKKNLLDSKYRFQRIYAIHYLMEQNAITMPEVEKLILQHVEKWFDNEDYEEELGYLYEILTTSANEKYLDILHKGLTHKKAVIRNAAIVGITKINSPKSFNILLNALKDESPAVREYAKSGLEALIDNPIELDIKTIDPKTEEGRKKIDAQIEKIKKEWKEK